MFQLYKILHPTWYYTLPQKTKLNTFWVDYRKLKNDDFKNIDICQDYKEKSVSIFDVSYQLFMGGYIDIDKSKILEDEQRYYPKLLTDQYRFLRRFNKPIWVFFTFAVRLFSFNNPINEIKGYLDSRSKVTNVVADSIISKNKYFSFKSNLIKDKPLVSIIVPTLNRYHELKKILNDLEGQSYKNFELIVVDQSDEFDASFYKKFSLKITYIRQKNKALWKARNRAIKKSIGEYILLLDDDSRVSSNWIEEHLKCIDYFCVKISAGASIGMQNNSLLKQISFFRWGDKLDTGNTMLKREVFQKCGLFDTKFEKMRMGDHEYGVRCYINNYNIIYNPYALRVHTKAQTGGLRFFNQWDGIRGIKVFTTRPVPSILYLTRKYWGTKATIYFLIKILPLSVIPFKYKGKTGGSFISLILFILFSPIVLSQLFTSWIKSSNLLKQKSSIKYLENKKQHLNVE